MVFQRLLDSERFPALIAGEWLRRLRPLVTLEMVLKRLLFPVRSFTLRAREGQRGFSCLVAQNVIFQRRLLQETPATLIARKRLLVDLHVLLQFAFPVKTEVAVLTEEPPRCLRIRLSQSSARLFS